MKHRVLYLNPFGAIGGAERILLDLLAALDRKRYEPMVAAPGDGPLGAKMAAMGVPFFPLDFPRQLELLSLRGKRSTFGQVLRSLPGALRVVSSVLALVSEVKPALIHTNGIKAHVIGTIAGGLAGIPVVWHVHDFLMRGVWESLIVALGRVGASRIIANSHAVRRSLADRGLEGKTTAIPNGVDLDVFSPAAEGEAFRRELGIAGDVPLIGMVGILAPWKGQDVFVRAAAVIHDREPAVRFVVVGARIYRTAGHDDYCRLLERQVTDAGLQRVITFTGYREDIPQVLAALDVVVHASVQPEPFGLVVLEAMACGRAVVATDAGGIPEVLGTDGSAGTLVVPNDSEAMATAVLKLAGDERRRKQMGMAGRKRAEEFFDIRLHARRVEDVYDAVVRRF